jgi:hypothetical protein
VVQRDLANWKKGIAEERAKRKELEKKPVKPEYIQRQELRK